MVKRFIIGVAVIGLLLAAGFQKAEAAFQERDILDEINNSVAVLRYLHRQIKDIEEKQEMVRDTRLLTEKQQAAEQKLVSEAQQELEAVRKQLEEAQGNNEAEEKLKEEVQKGEIRVDVFKISLDKLNRQTEELARVNLEKTYTERLQALRNMVRRYQVNLDAKLLEFRVHFGKTPSVDLDFEAEISRFRQRTLGVTYLTIR